MTHTELHKWWGHLHVAGVTHVLSALIGSWKTQGAKTARTSAKEESSSKTKGRRCETVFVIAGQNKRFSTFEPENPLSATVFLANRIKQLTTIGWFLSPLHFYPNAAQNRLGQVARNQNWLCLGMSAFLGSNVIYPWKQGRAKVLIQWRASFFPVKSYWNYFFHLEKKQYCC